MKKARQKPERVLIILEGGGESSKLRAALRRAFEEFLEAAGFRGRMPRIVAVGRRDAAFQRFKGEVGRAMLLVDSETPVTTDDPWEHLAESAKWARPDGARADQAHLMVRCMEAWFLADRDALAAFFGEGFRDGALPGGPIESVAPSDLLAGLKNATRDSKKGRYGKAAHSFRLLALLDPVKVRGASPWADRFLESLDGATRA